MYVPCEEFVGPEHLVDALAVIAATGEFVGAAGVADVFDRSAQHFEAAVEHFALDEACPAVVFAVEDYQGGANIIYVSDGDSCWRMVFVCVSQG